MISTRLFFPFMLAVLHLGESCKRDSVDFNNCIVDKMNKQQRLVDKGMVQLKIAPLDPLFITRIHLKQGEGPVSINLELTNQTFRGIKNYKIETAKVDLKNYQMEFTLSLPEISIEGNSKVEGRILLLPMSGNGYGWSNYTTVHGKAVIKGHPITRDNKEFFALDKVKLDLSVKKGLMHMDRLFNGNRELGEAMNKFMADNWEVVFQELRPVIEETVEAIVQDVAKKILNHYSLDDMFPK